MILYGSVQSTEFFCKSEETRGVLTPSLPSHLSRRRRPAENVMRDTRAAKGKLTEKFSDFLLKMHHFQAISNPKIFINYLINSVN